MTSGLALPVLPGDALPLPTEAVAPLSSAVLAKLVRIEDAMRARGAVVVAYSGGVDSSLLAAVGMKVLGPWREADRRGCLAVLADSATLARDELTLARATADALGVPLAELSYSELSNPQWVANDGMRCYHCKKDLAGALEGFVRESGLDRSLVAFGITASDLLDHRPGITATREADGWLPLVEAGVTKPEVRALARHLGVPVWDKPATPCLASRVQYGEGITRDTLTRVESAESAVRALGFRVLRVRHHGQLARIEVPAAELARALALRQDITAALRGCGYTFVTLDLVGFRSGAMNETLGLS